MHSADGQMNYAESRGPDPQSFFMHRYLSFSTRISFLSGPIGSSWPKTYEHLDVNSEKNLSPRYYGGGGKSELEGK